MLNFKPDFSLFSFTFMHWRRKWQPTPVFLPGESQGQRSLVGCCLWGRTELDKRAWASSWNDCGTTWFFSSCGGIFELPQGIHASSCVGPQKSYLPRLVITFLLRSKRLLNSWLQSPSSVILELKDIKSVTVSTFPPFTCHKVMGPDAMILVL